MAKQISHEWQEVRYGEYHNGEPIELVDGDCFENCHFYNCEFPSRMVRLGFIDCTFVNCTSLYCKGGSIAVGSLLVSIA